MDASFAILNIATSFLLIQNYGVIYKSTTSEQVLAIFEAAARTFVSNSKIPSFVQSQMNLLVKSLFSFPLFK